jgi:hypothetical protein
VLVQPLDLEPESSGTMPTPTVEDDETIDETHLGL